MIGAIIEAVSAFILLVIEKIGYAGIFFLMLLQSFNIPIPSEVIMTFSGFLVQKGDFNFWLTVFAGAAGNLAGALISYKLAHFLLDNDFINRFRLIKFFLNERNLRLSERWFEKYGKASVFFGRLVPVVSTFISFPAGLARMNVLSFSILTFSGSFIWSTFLTWLGSIFGENWTTVRFYFEKFDYLVLLAILAGIILWLRLHFRKAVVNNNINIG